VIKQFVESKLLLWPKKLGSNYEYSFKAKFEEGFLDITKKVSVNYLHFKTTRKRKGVVLYFHGNADNLARWGSVHDQFLPNGYDLIIMDYRGFGKSNGQSTERILYSDALRFYKLARRNYRAKEIIIYGRSLGTAVASYLGSKVSAKQLILETPFHSFQDLLNSYPVKWPFDLHYQLNNAKHIKSINYPVYIFQGTRDRVVPYKSAIKLKPLLKNPEHFITIKNGAHKNLDSFELFRNSLKRILKD